jgi:formate-dependent nitrite reductase membrane component NrfD
MRGETSSRKQTKPSNKPISFSDRKVNSELFWTAVMSFGIYIVGFLILIGGLIYGAVILHVATHWIAVGAMVLLGLAILKGVQATRGKDPSS